jgi:hypothetical protein
MMASTMSAATMESLSVADGSDEVLAQLVDTSSAMAVSCWSAHRMVLAEHPQGWHLMRCTCPSVWPGQMYT